jgi:regulator of cell morphogenesis and NO signaling
MIDRNHKLSDVICTNIDLLPIISRFGIKSEIREKNIREICEEKKIDLQFFLAVINTFNSDDYFPQPAELELSPLISFLTATHQYHQEITIPHVSELVELLKKESADRKFVLIIEKYFKEYVQKLLKHIEFEEKEIFPLVKNLGLKKPKISRANLRDLFHQHENVESEISDLLKIIIRHIPERSDIRLIHEILHSLSHFEKEQVDHARFEEKILVPKLMALLK